MIKKLQGLKNHKNLKIFYTLGFIYRGDSGISQVYGNCPICNEHTFYINPNKDGQAKWDCKSCFPSGGGYQTFLKEIYSDALKNTTEDNLTQLSERKKGIKIETLKYFGIAYIDRIGKYVIPVWNIEKTELFNLRIYNPKDNLLKNAPGSKAILYNLWNLDNVDNYLTVWLVEGEWDAMIMHQILDTCGIDQSVVLGVPGAGIFKDTWSYHFRKKIVHVVYDNDKDKVKKERLIVGAGKAGQEKVRQVLGKLPAEIKFINWLNKHKDKYDLRDLYNDRRCNDEKTLKILITLLQNKPMPIIAPKGYEKEAQNLNQSEKKIVSFTGSGLHFTDVYKGYQKWLHLDDLHCLDAMFGAVIGNRFQGDPIWLFIVASSGGTKSELIMSMDDAPLIYSLSSLTPNTLVSGSAGSGASDPSLIPRLDGQVLCIKDFTVLLDMMQQSRDMIISQFRDAYDGRCAKEFGTGAQKHYESKFGLIAGVTPVIEYYLQNGSAMGERFISFYFKEDHSFKANSLIMNKAYENVMGGEKDKMREDLKVVAEKVINYDYGKNQPDFPDQLKEKLFALAQWTSVMRGTVPRDKYTKQVTRKALVEKPTRLLIQFLKLTLGITAFRYKNKVTSDELDLVARVAMGTVPHHLNLIVRLMCKANIDGKYTAEKLSRQIRLPFDATDRYLQDLFQLRILESKSYSIVTKEYYINKEIKKLIKLGNLYERKNSWSSKSGKILKFRG